MTNFKSKFLSIAFTFFCLTGFSQTLNTINSLESAYQKCLDKGQFMRGCSNTFYSQMDSLLNLQYRKLREKCDSVQKANLKDDQLRWLNIRDKQFKFNKQQVYKEAKENGYDGGQDEIMILTDKNTMFVKDRVIELIKKSPDDYSADKYKIKTYKILTE
jgi:uncharacterized protein YecT (DUF1311 family)